MIILKDKPALMGNRLWAFSPFIAESLRTGNRVLILYFGDYTHFFENLKSHPLVRFVDLDNVLYYKFLAVALRVIRWLPASLWRVFRVYVKRDWHQENWPREILADQRNIVFLSAWSSEKPMGDLSPYREALTTLFAPKREAVAKVEAFLKTAAQGCDLVIGVHIRRGNYKDFLGGAYYWEDGCYEQYMQELVKDPQLKDKKLGFLLCSEKPIDLGTFRGFTAFQLPDASGIEDVYAMSRCDYIMGPPSTFAMWASFCGQVPLRILKYPQGALKVSEFSPIIAQDRFANGEVFEHVEVVGESPQSL